MLMLRIYGSCSHLAHMPMQLIVPLKLTGMLMIIFGTQQCSSTFAKICIKRQMPKSIVGAYIPRCSLWA